MESSAALTGTLSDKAPSDKAPSNKALSGCEPDMAYGFTQATEEVIIAIKYFKMGAQLQSRSVIEDHSGDSVRYLS